MILVRLLRIGWQALLAALVRPRCAACDGAIEADAIFCTGCAGTVEPVSQPARLGGQTVHAFGAYGGALSLAICAFKYRSRPDLARPLGELLRRTVRQLPRDRGWDVVVPVPLHPLRLAWRGYNQAALLARIVATELGRPICTSSLRRTVNTPAQAELSGDARRRNVRDAFTADRRLRGKRVLLIDDVATTGATLASCAAALRAAGADVGAALVLARAQGGDDRVAGLH